MGIAPREINHKGGRTTMERESEKGTENCTFWSLKKGKGEESGGRQ